MKKKEILQKVAKKILSIKKDSPLLVGVNGVDAAGKTIFAKDLSDQLRQLSQRQIIEASIDGFHNPKSIRYKKGKNSPEGFYLDSFNNKSLQNLLLKPLSSGNLKYKSAIFDWKTSSELTLQTEIAQKSSILIMEGIFLFRPELVDYWDMKIFIDVDFNITAERGIKRDMEYDINNSETEIMNKYKHRYIPGQEMYFKESQPKNIADIIINNNDFEAPFITKI